MKNIIVITLLLMAFSVSLYAQKDVKPVNDSCKLDCYSGTIYMNHVKLSKKEVYSLYKNNEKALDIYTSAQTQYSLSTLLAVGSIGFSVAGIGMMLAGYDTWYYPAVPGLVFLCGSFVFYSGANSTVCRSVNVYNSSLKTSMKIEAGMTGNGIGIVMKF